MPTTTIQPTSVDHSQAMCNCILDDFLTGKTITGYIGNGQAWDANVDTCATISAGAAANAVLTAGTATFDATDNRSEATLTGASITTVTTFDQIAITYDNGAGKCVVKVFNYPAQSSVDQIDWGNIKEFMAPSTVLTDT